MSKSQYLVWFDLLLEEWVSCPKDEATDNLLSALAHEKTVVHTVSAEYPLEAIARIKNPTKNAKSDVEIDITPEVTTSSAWKH